MSRIVLSTSSSGLGNLDIKTNIQLIPMRLFVNNVEFIDGKNITQDRLISIMSDAACSAVHTSPAPAEEIDEILTNLYEQGYKEVFITVTSSGLSESYNIIKQVAQRFQDRMYVYVYDTKELNMCEAILALEAEHMLEQGESMSKIARRLDELRASHKLLFAIDTLSTLIKNKKLSATAGFFANMFNIKPVLQMTDDGKLIAINKIRKLERALDYIVEDFADSLQRPNTFAYILTMGRTDIDNYLINLIKRRTGIQNIPLLPVSNISMGNTGPTGVGLCVFEGEMPYAAQLLR